MTDREKSFVQTDAKFDQVWKDADEKLGDFQRLLMRGPTRFGDEELIQVALALLVGELYRRRSLNRPNPEETHDLGGEGG